MPKLQANQIHIHQEVSDTVIPVEGVLILWEWLYQELLLEVFAWWRGYLRLYFMLFPSLKGVKYVHNRAGTEPALRNMCVTL